MPLACEIDPSIASHSASVDDRDTPLGWSGRRQNALLVNRREAKYFCVGGLDTVSRVEIAGEIRFCAHAFFGRPSGVETPRMNHNRARQHALFCPSGNELTGRGGLPPLGDDVSALLFELRRTSRQAALRRCRSGAGKFLLCSRRRATTLGWV